MTTPRYLPPSARMRQIKAKAPVANPDAVAAAPAKPEYDERTLKSELLTLAQAAGLDMTGSNTKAEIITALDEHYGA